MAFFVLTPKVDVVLPWNCSKKTSVGLAYWANGWPIWRVCFRRWAWMCRCLEPARSMGNGINRVVTMEGGQVESTADCIILGRGERCGRARLVLVCPFLPLQTSWYRNKPKTKNLNDKVLGGCERCCEVIKNSRPDPHLRFENLNVITAGGKAEATADKNPGPGKLFNHGELPRWWAWAGRCSNYWKGYWTCWIWASLFCGRYGRDETGLIYSDPDFLLCYFWQFFKTCHLRVPFYCYKYNTRNECKNNWYNDINWQWFIKIRSYKISFENYYICKFIFLNQSSCSKTAICHAW